MPAHRFVLPNRIAVEHAANGEHSYSIYNYYGRGPIAAAKRRRFQRALDLAAPTRASNVIDMGTGDGVLLPTLAQHYRRVVALDVDQKFIERSQRLLDLLKLDNVEALYVRDIPFPELRKRIGSGFQLMFLLETLEHAGSQPDLWGSKMNFLSDCFSLLEENGRIVVSVPKMVGLVMLLKNTLQRSLGLGYDRMTFRQLLRSSLLKKTDDLEPLWRGDHVGFNHRKLEKHLGQHFVVHHRSESLISVFYVLGQRSAGA